MNANRLAGLISFCFFLSASATPFDPDFRANRPEPLGNGAPVGANGCNLEPVIQLLQGIQCDLNNFECSLTCSLPCAHTPICFATTITTSGAYCLCQDITGVITIAANDVDLDLNSYTISGGVNGVVINTGLQNVRVHNGTITNTTSSGILVNQSTSSIMLDNLQLTNIATDLTTVAAAIQLAGNGANRVDQAILRNISINQAQSGISAFDTDHTIIDNCSVFNCLTTAQDSFGIEFVGTTATCKNNRITNCTVSNCTNLTGFAVSAIGIHVAESILIENVLTSSVMGAERVALIFVSTSQDVVINNCSLFNLQCENVIQGIPLAAINLTSCMNVTITNCYISDIVVNAPLADSSIGIFAFGTSSQIIIDNVFISNIGSPPTSIFQNNYFSAGIVITPGFFPTGVGIDATIRNCICRGITSPQAAAGYIFDGSNIQCVNCLATNITGFLCTGFDTIGGNGTIPSQGANRNFAGCRASQIISNGQSTGFRIDGTGGTLIDCEADTIICTATTNIPSGGNFAAGYAVFPTCTEITFVNCVANDMENGVKEYGFFISGNSCYLQNCLVSNTQFGIYVPFFGGVPTAPTINNCQVVHCNGAGLSGIGIDILNQPATQAIVTNCYAANNDTNYFGVSNIATAGVTTNGAAFVGYNTSA